MIKKGFYIVKDEFFEEMEDPYLKGNKKSNRPYYYCFSEDNTGLLWMIPLSSKVDKYSRIIENKKKKGRNCDIIHIAKLDNNKESVFLIQDMFPITEKYIEREYTICKNHLTITSEHLKKEIEKKAKKVKNMIEKDVKFIPTQPNIKKIINKLLSN